MRDKDIGDRDVASQPVLPQWPGAPVVCARVIVRHVISSHGGALYIYARHGTAACFQAVISLRNRPIACFSIWRMRSADTP